MPDSGLDTLLDFSMVDFGNDSLVEVSGIANFDQGLNGITSGVGDELAILRSAGQPPLLNPYIPTSIDYCPIADLATNYVNSVNSVGNLVYHQIPDPVAAQSATLVMQALRAIPEGMLRRDTFPPFIYQQSHLQALPEPLAICMRIAQIFTTRTPDIKSFIWRTIKAEQIRILEEAGLCIRVMVFITRPANDFSLLSSMSCLDKTFSLLVKPK